MVAHIDIANHAHLTRYLLNNTPRRSWHVLTSHWCEFSVTLYYLCLPSPITLTSYLMHTLTHLLDTVWLHPQHNIVANYLGISGTVPDFMPLSQVGPGRPFYIVLIVMKFLPLLHALVLPHPHVYCTTYIVYTHVQRTNLIYQAFAITATFFCVFTIEQSLSIATPMHCSCT